MAINIILDDDLENRITPQGFTRFTTGNDLIAFMVENPDTEIDYITFDNDLGTGLPEGYDVVKILINDQWHVNHLNVHSANTVASRNMIQILSSAIRHDIIPVMPMTQVPLASYALNFA